MSVSKKFRTRVDAAFESADQSRFSMKPTITVGSARSLCPINCPIQTLEIDLLPVCYFPILSVPLLFLIFCFSLSASIVSEPLFLTSMNDKIVIEVVLLPFLTDGSRIVSIIFV